MNEQTLSNIRDIRRSMDFKQKHIADILGISQTYYSGIENGKKNLTNEIKKGLSAIYDMEWEEIENYNKKNNSAIKNMQKKIEALEADIFLLKNVFKNIAYIGG